MPTEPTLGQSVAPFTARYAAVVGAACAWQARYRSGPRTDPELFTMICALAELDGRPDVGPTRWTRAGVSNLIRVTSWSWCVRHSCAWPDELFAAMWEWIEFLFATARLDPRSDPVGELRKPLMCMGLLDQHGAALLAGASTVVVCECALPYRETAQILLELSLRHAQGCSPHPLDLLRAHLGRPPRTGP